MKQDWWRTHDALQREAERIRHCPAMTEMERDTYEMALRVVASLAAEAWPWPHGAGRHRSEADLQPLRDALRTLEAKRQQKNVAGGRACILWDFRTQTAAEREAYGAAEIVPLYANEPERPS